jgi:hypothetical protein
MFFDIMLQGYIDGLDAFATALPAPLLSKSMEFG